MSTILEQKLNTIANEKINKIIPENIKKGVTVLGITGTYEGSGGTTVEGIKQFSTIEEMQVDKTAKEGDLAIVYRNEVKNATVDSKFQVATFPETVVLDTALTDYVEVRYIAVDSSKTFDCWGQLDSNMFMMDCYTESGSIRIVYESSDSITYTRTRMQGDSGNLENPVDFGCEIYYEMAEMWNDVIGKFIQIGGNTFEGFYKCGILTDSRIVIPKLINTNFDVENKRFSVTINKDDTIIDTEKLKPIMQNIIQDNNITNLSNMHLLEKNDGIYLGYTTHTNSSGTRYYDYANGVGVTSDGDILNYILGSAWYTTGANNIQYYLFKVDLETTSYNRVSIIDAELKHWGSNFTAWFAMDDIISIPVYINISSGSVSLGKFQYETTDNVSNYSLTISNANDLKYTYKGYALAPTQLDATAGEVFEKAFYGKNGVETGTLGDEISTSTGFINSVELYDKLETINIDKDINLNNVLYNSNIQSLPKINVDSAINIGGLCNKCTNLINASTINAPNVTTANAIFSQCSSMITAPEIILPKATITRHILSHCTSLVNVPVYDFPLATNLDNMFYNDTALSDESLNNIMQTCINLTAFTALGENLTLKYIGLTEEQANKCKTLSNYSAFTAAGWTTGY